MLLLYLKWITNNVLLYSTGNSAQCWVAAWKGGVLRENDTCMWGWVPLLYTWNFHNIVNQLYSITKQKVWKKKKIDWLHGQAQNQLSGTRKVSFILFLFHILIFLWLLVLMKIFIRTLAGHKLQKQEFRGHIWQRTQMSQKIVQKQTSTEQSETQNKPWGNNLIFSYSIIIFKRSSFQ